MRATKTIALCLLLAITTTIASGQVAYVLRAPGVGQTEGFYLPSAAYPGGSNAANPRVPTPSLPNFFSGAAAPSAAFPGQGGHAVNEKTGMMLSSDGFKVWEEPHPLYPQNNGTPLAPVSGPNGIQWGYPSFFPQLSAYPPPIMGMTVDSRTNTLWMCDLIGFRSFSATWPYAPLNSNNYVSLWSLQPNFLTSFFTGITHDPADDTLWLCDNMGSVYHVETNGTPIGSQPVASGMAPLKGITVDTGNGVGSWAPSSCSPAPIGGFHVIVTDGNSLIDPLSGNTLPLDNPGDAYGLAFSSDGQYSHGITPSNTATLRIERPFIGDVGPILLHLEGALPYELAALAWGICPAFPGFPFLGGNLRVSDGFIWPLWTDSGGATTVSIPAHLLPAGFEFTVQWIHRTSQGHGPGWALTDAMTLTLGQQ